MKNIVHFLLFVGNAGFMCLLLLPFRLTFQEWFATSLILAYFHTKSIINKQDLENQIFELKELVKSKQL